MTKKNNFWTLAIIIALCIGFSSCGKENGNIDNEDNGSNEHKALLVGQWHFASGSLHRLIGENNTNIYSQQLTFNSVGNFSEVNLLRTTEERYNGNWSISGNVITLRDWDGNPLENPINIISLSENRLEVSFSGAKTVFLRESTQFSNLQTRILGRWYVVGHSQNFTEFRNDGTGRTVSFPISNNPQVMQQSQFEWSIEDNALTRRFLNVAGTSGTSVVIFCNDKYMRLRGSNGTISNFRRN